MSHADDLIVQIQKGMQAHGYALVSSAFPPHRDALVMRFVVKGDPVLAQRLPPIAIEVSGLEIMTALDLAALARMKVADAMDAP